MSSEQVSEIKLKNQVKMYQILLVILALVIVFIFISAAKYTIDTNMVIGIGLITIAYFLYSYYERKRLNPDTLRLAEYIVQYYFKKTGFILNAKGDNVISWRLSPEEHLIHFKDRIITFHINTKQGIIGIQNAYLSEVKKQIAEDRLMERLLVEQADTDKLKAQLEKSGLTDEQIRKYIKEKA